MIRARLLLFFICLILCIYGLSVWFRSPAPFPVGEFCGRGSVYTQHIPEGLGIYGGNRISYICEEPMKPTGIVLHYTVTNSFHHTLDVLERRGLYVHLVVDTNGKTYQIMDSLTERAAGAPGSNGWAIHIEIVGDRDSVLADALNNGPQSQEVIRLIRALSREYGIPLQFTPSDPSALVWHGVFSHQQISELHPLGLGNGKTDPGEAYMSKIQEGLQ